MGGDIDARHHNRDATGPPTGWTQDLCFQTCPRRGAVRLPVTALHLARPVSRRKRRCSGIGPRGSGRFGKLRLPRGPPLGSDTFTLHDVEQHAPAKARAMRRLDGPAANFFDADGLRGSGSVVDRPFRSDPSPEAMVEQDGIEPTTSCLQSTRSTD